MCYIGCTKGGIIEHVAENNIPVTKVLHVGPFKNMISLNYNFIYELNKVYKVNDFEATLFDNDSQIIINRGFHSYAKPIDVDFRDYRDGWIAIYLLGGNILRSFQTAFPVNRELGSYIYKAAIADCIIPKGSHYYVNCFGECVSDAIKIINVYKIDIK